jgi:hypothetical protein
MSDWLGNFRTVQLYRGIGPARFWGLMIGVLAFIGGWTALDMWLSDKTGWPDAYGFHCRGRGCTLDNLWHSPALLHRHDPYELGLFASIWFLPAVVAGAALYALVKKSRRNPIFQSDLSE